MRPPPLTPNVQPPAQWLLLPHTLVVLALGSLLAHHAYLISTATTTIELRVWWWQQLVKGARSPYSEGVVQNWRQVFGGGGAAVGRPTMLALLLLPGPAAVTPPLWPPWTNAGPEGARLMDGFFEM